MIGIVCLVILTIFIPPLGVFFIAGCGADLLVNILLTILGYFPGHIHAFYLEYVYYKRREQAQTTGVVDAKPAPGVYSERIQTGGKKVVAQQPVGAVNEPAVGGVPPQQSYGTVPAGRV